MFTQKTMFLIYQCSEIFMYILLTKSVFCMSLKNKYFGDYFRSRLSVPYNLLFRGSRNAAKGGERGMKNHKQALSAGSGVGFWALGVEGEGVG